MRNTSLIAFAAIASFSGTLSAQPADLTRESRASGSVAVIQSFPQGNFGRNTGTSYGISGALLYRLDRAGIFSIRADLADIQYGHERKRTPLSDEVGGRILVDVNTTNSILPGSIGPQITLPTGAVRPYVTAGIGAVAFLTQSTVGGTDDGSVIASTTNQSDVNMMWTAGSGFYVRLREGRVPLMLDVGAYYMDGGRARYLAPGSIVDLPDGEVQITPIESRTQMLLVRVGVRIGR